MRGFMKSKNIKSSALLALCSLTALNSLESLAYADSSSKGWSDAFWDFLNGSGSHSSSCQRDPRPQPSPSPVSLKPVCYDEHFQESDGSYSNQLDLLLVVE